MDVTIDRTTENQFDFDLEIKGLEAKAVVVRLILEINDQHSLLFPCRHVAESKWEVTIPKLSTLEKGTYKFSIDVVVDGYFFEALSGTISVKGVIESSTERTVVATNLQSKKQKAVESILQSLKGI